MLKGFDKIRKELKKIEDNREKAITNSREIINLSKQIIYSVHRDNLKKAGEQVKLITRLFLLQQFLIISS